MRILALFTTYFICNFIYQVEAQDLRSFTVSDLFNSHHISGAVISPNQAYAAVVVERPKKDQVIYSFRGISFRKDIWLLDLKTLQFEKVLDGQIDSCSYWNPVWSPDNNKFAVLSTKGLDNVRTFIYDLNTQTLEQVHPNGTNLMCKMYQGEQGLNDPYLWLDANNLLVSILAPEEAYNTFRMDYLPLKKITTAWNNSKYNHKTSANILDTDSLHLYPRDSLAGLIRYNIATKSYSEIASGFFRHVLKSPQKKALLAVKRVNGLPLGEIELIRSAWNFNHQAGFIDPDQDKQHFLPIEQLNASASTGRQPHYWTNNGRFVILQNKQKKYTGYYDMTDSSFHPFKATFSSLKQIKGRLFLKGPNNWFQLSEEDASLKLIADLPQMAPKPNIQGVQLAQTGDLSISKKTDDQGLHLMLTRRGKTQHVRSFNPWVSQIELSRKEIISFTDGFGKPQQALLLLPEKSANKFPLVVSAYPGRVIRKNAIERDYRHSDSYVNPLIFVSKGYAVLIPTIDTRSTDESLEYHQFILPAVESIQAHPEIDQDKVALLGLSQGGYLVYALLSQTTRFQSGIALAAYGNMLSLYGSFDIRYRYTDNPFENVGRLRATESGPGGFNTPPSKNLEKYIKNSPVRNSSKIETPLLIIQGDKDYVSIEQGEEMFTQLYRQGKKARFVRFWGEGHNISAPKNIKRMWEEIFKWLEETL